MAIQDNFDYHPSNDPLQVRTDESHSILWQIGGSIPSSITEIAKERWTVMCKVYGNSGGGGRPGCFESSGDSWIMNMYPLDTFTVLFTEMTSFSPAQCFPVCGGCTSNGSAQIMLYNENSVLQKTIQLMQDQNIIHSHEFQLIGNNIYHIRDGVISNLGAWSGSYISYIKFYSYAYVNSGYGANSGTSIYIDNFSINSIIGISADRHPDAYNTHQILDSPLDHPDDEIDVTYQLAYSPPSSYINSEYKIKVRKLTGELINEAVIKPMAQDATPLTPPFGTLIYSIATLFNNNYGYYNFELTKNDVSISSDYVFYKYIPAAGSSTVNVPDSGIVGSNIDIGYTITPYQPSVYNYIIKVFNPSNVEIFTYNALQASGTTTFNTSVVPGSHNIILYSIDKVTSQIYESAYDSITITEAPCVPNWVCRQPLDGYEHDANNCGQPDRLNPACDAPAICSWITSKGGWTNIAIFDIMTLISAYLQQTNLGFTVTISHIMGAVAYYLDNMPSGNSLTGCSFA